MESVSFPQKRIWEVDCLSMDAVLAAGFDWRELSNFLAASGQAVKTSPGPDFGEMRAQFHVHRHCHSENPVSLRIEELLNRWYAGTLKAVQRMTVAELSVFLAKSPLKDRMGALFWALGTDGRTQADCLRRRFHQRVQVQSIRFMQQKSMETYSLEAS